MPLYITEYEHLAEDPFGRVVMAGMEPAEASQVISVSGSSTASAAFASTTRYVKIHTDEIVSIKFGAAPTATTSNDRLVAGDTQFYGLGKLARKVAVISNT